MSELGGEILLRILRLVECFEDDWKRGEPRSLAALMRDGAVAVGEGIGQAELLLSALAVELKYRRRRGEVPACAAYEQRFPEHVGGGGARGGGAPGGAGQGLAGARPQRPGD